MLPEATLPWRDQLALEPVHYLFGLQGITELQEMSSALSYVGNWSDSHSRPEAVKSGGPYHYEFRQSALNIDSLINLFDDE